MTGRVGPLRSAAFSGLLLACLAFSPNLSRAAESEPPGSGAPGEIHFVAENALVTADGRFERWRFTHVALDREAPEQSVVEVEVDVASLATGITRRDDHLRSPDFFDVAKFPVATVRVSNARANGENAAGRPVYTAHFELEIHGIRKAVEGEFELVSLAPGDAALEVQGSLLLDRLDFGVGGPHRGWNPMSVRREIPVRFRAVLPVQEIAAEERR
jgi:polyisoprenoid-binding protein YceI